MVGASDGVSTEKGDAFVKGLMILYGGKPVEGEQTTEGRADLVRDWERADALSTSSLRKRFQSAATSVLPSNCIRQSANYEKLESPRLPLNSLRPNTVRVRTLESPISS
jgi:hypothetical protein